MGLAGMHRSNLLNFLVSSFGGLPLGASGFTGQIVNCVTIILPA